MTVTNSLNQFRQVDALEYSEAYRTAGLLSPDAIRERLSNLNKRMSRIQSRARPVPSYLLAAYRGYEDALSFAENPTWFLQWQGENPYIITLDQSKEGPHG